nr:lysozyme [Brevundimonas basaltis]
MKVSREGVVLIKSFEGFRPRAVRNEDGRWVIGYGHTVSAREGSTVGEADAELLLQYDLLPVVKALNERVSIPLNQHQFDALASFAISVGVDRFLASDVLQRLNEGHAGEAADALIGWPEAAPPDARLRRRAAERALFVADPATPIHLADLLAAPLPPPPVEDEPSELPTPPDSPGDARAAAVAALLGETPAAPRTGSDRPEDSMDAVLPEEVAGFEPTAFQTATPVTTIHLQRYSPYAGSRIGPLPGFPPAGSPKAVPEPDSTPEPAAENPPTDVPTTAQAESAEPVVPLVPPTPGNSPFPPMDEQLVLTPATEADFGEPARTAWEPGQRTVAAAPDGDTVLFEQEPAPSVLRHEVEPAAPRRFDWSVTGAWVIMGLTGLAACAAAAASFRKAMVDESSLNDFMVIGWILALIGVICVGVSAWNLFVQWGRRD